MHAPCLVAGASPQRGNASQQQQQHAASQDEQMSPAYSDLTFDRAAESAQGTQRSLLLALRHGGAVTPPSPLEGRCFEACMNSRK